MFYSKNPSSVTGSYLVTESAEELVNNSAIEASAYDDFTEGALTIVAESEANFNQLMMSIGIYESQYYAESGEMVVYTEGMISSVIEKIKAFLKKLWDKIKALFKRFVLMFDQYFSSDATFLKKYKSRILKSSVKDLNFTGYPFNNAKGISKTNEITADAAKAASCDANSYNTTKTELSKAKFNEAELNKIEERYDDILEAIRAELIGQSGTLTAEEFREEVFILFHGEKEKEKLDEAQMALTTQVAILEGSKKTISSAEKGIRNFEKFINDAIKEIERQGKDDQSKTQDTKEKAVIGKAVAIGSKLVRDTGTMGTTLLGGMLTGLKDQNRQARAICAKAIVKSGKINEESAGIEHPAYGASFLSDIEFK